LKGRGTAKRRLRRARLWMVAKPFLHRGKAATKKLGLTQIVICGFLFPEMVASHLIRTDDDEQGVMATYPSTRFGLSQGVATPTSPATF
jgi:hypothetical protein